MKDMRRILTAAALLMMLPLAGQERKPAVQPYKIPVEESKPQTQWAVIDLSSCYIRVRPDYTAGLDTQAQMGAVCEVDARESYWNHVKCHDPLYEGWVTDRALARMTEAEKDAYIAAPKYICVEEYTRIYEEPSASSARICDFIYGDLVRQTGVKKGKWVKVMLPSGVTGWTPKSAVADFADYIAACNPTAENVIAIAKKLVGVPYLWGGNTIKGTDCSGLMRVSYFMNGVLLPRDAKDQIHTGDPLPADDLSAYKPGDLLFFGTKAKDGKPMRVSHVGMYIGDGKIIHSSLKVRISSLVPGGEDYYSREMVGACRVLGNIDNGKGIISTAKSPDYFKQ